MINCFKKFNLSSTTSVLKKYTISHKITLTQISAFCTLNYKNYDYGFKEVKFGPKKTRVIVNYNGNSFKLEEVNKVTNKDFLESFSKSVAPIIQLKKESYKETIDYRNKANFITDKDVHKIIFKHSKTKINLNGNEFRSMVDGNYLDEEDNILNYERVLVTETNFSKQSLVQRGVNIDFKKAYDRQFQESINTLTNSKTKREFKPVFNEFKYYNDNIYCPEIKNMLIKSFIEKNSSFLKFEIIEKVELSGINRVSLSNIPVIRNINHKSINTEGKCDDNHVDTEKYFPITIANSNNIEDFEQSIMDNYNILAGLTRLNNKPFAIGIATNFTNWKVLLYRNTGNKVETLKDFIISDFYKFNAISTSTENKGLEGSTNILLFNFFMEIVEKLSESSLELKTNYQSKVDKLTSQVQVTPKAIL